VYRQAGYACEVCGGKGQEYPVAAHEEWNYDDDKYVQRLVRLVALCPACHEVKHFGLAQKQGYGKRAVLHLAKVNGWTWAKAWQHVERAFALWESRSKREWTLDISVLGLRQSERKVKMYNPGVVLACAQAQHERTKAMCEKKEAERKEQTPGLLVEDTTVAGGKDATTGADVIRPKDAGGKVDENTVPTDEREAKTTPEK